MVGTVEVQTRGLRAKRDQVQVHQLMGCNHSECSHIRAYLDQAIIVRTDSKISQQMVVDTLVQVLQTVARKEGAQGSAGVGPNSDRDHTFRCLLVRKMTATMVSRTHFYLLMKMEVPVVVQYLRAMIKKWLKG